MNGVHTITGEVKNTPAVVKEVKTQIKPDAVDKGVTLPQNEVSGGASKKTMGQEMKAQKVDKSLSVYKGMNVEMPKISMVIDDVVARIKVKLAGDDRAIADSSQFMGDSVDSVKPPKINAKPVTGFVADGEEKGHEINLTKDLINKVGSIARMLLGG